jgi:hypothetical protein
MGVASSKPILLMDRITGSVKPNSLNSANVFFFPFTSLKVFIACPFWFFPFLKRYQPHKITKRIIAFPSNNPLNAIIFG